MANTTNLNLEELTVNDNLKTTFVNKLNSNQNKIDTVYGTLRDNLLDNTGKDNLTEAIEYVVGMAGQVQELTEDITELNSIGNANASEIFNGKTALVRGETVTGTALSEITTATTSDILNGKTAYSNDGTLLTGVLVTPSIEERTMSSSHSVQSVSFTFSKDVTNARIIFYAIPASTYLRNTSSVQYLMYADSETNMFGALYHSSSSSTYSLLYNRNTYYSITKSGTSCTISGSSASYLVGGYSSSYPANLHCIAIWS